MGVDGATTESTTIDRRILGVLSECAPPPTRALTNLGTGFSPVGGYTLAFAVH